MYQDGKLAFVTDPGTSFGYSGAAYEILAHFLEQKLDTDFETLVRKAVFDPIGMTGVSMSRRRSIDARVTTPMDSNGVYGKPYTSDQPHPAGSSWNAADDLFVTVQDYARFLIGVARHEGLNSVLAAEQTRLHSSFSGVSEWECIPEPSLRCPDRYGFGLGWMVFEYGNTVIIQNGGNDSGEHALVYFSPNAPGDATVIFVNGGNGILVTLDIIDLIDDRQKFVAYYRQLIDRAQRSR